MDDFTCSICLQPMSDPVRLVTGHVYDRECISTWFRSRPPPHTCPLSNVVLPTTELLPVSDGRTATAPPPGVVMVASAPPLPDRQWYWAVPWVLARIVVFFVHVGVDDRQSFTPEFALVNLGATYDVNVWRCVSCLFTDTNAIIMIGNAAFQFTMFTVVLKHGLCCTNVAVCAALGAFAAGVAFPDTAYAGGLTLSCVAGVAGLCLALEIGSRSLGGLAVTGVVATFTAGLSRGNELLSHLVGSFFYLTLVSISYSRTTLPLTAYSVAVCVLLAFFCTHSSVPALSFLSPQL